MSDAPKSKMSVPGKTGLMAGGTGVGVSVMQVAYWALSTYTNMPAEVVLAAVGLLPTIGGYFAGKLAHKGADKE